MPSRRPDEAPQGRPPRVTAASHLLTLVHRRGPLSRAEITVELGLARSAVGTVLDELAALRLVRVGTPTVRAGTPTGRGRPSPEVSVDPDGPVTIAVQLSRGTARAAVIGLDHRIDRLHDAVRLEPQDPETAVDVICRLVARLREQSPRRCVGIGVALPGFIRSADGYVHSNLHLAWRDVPLAALLAERIPDAPPIAVGRSSALAARAEYLFGTGRGAANLLTLNCEHLGIGGGLITDGVPLVGAGYALEAGHVLVEPAGLSCPCGARGCLELYADGRGLLRAAGFPEDRARDAQAEVPGVLSAAAEGEERAVEAVRTTATHLATGMASLINVLSPDRIALTGFLAALYRAAGPLIDEEVARSSVVARAGTVTITTGTLQHPGLIGAAELAFAPLLSNPTADVYGDV